MENVVMTVRVEKEAKEAIETLAASNGTTVTAEIRDIIDDYLRNNYVDSAVSAYDDPGLFDALPEERQKEILSYINETYTDADTYHPGTSYGMKHGEAEEKLGYLKNGEFKGAMLAAGYLPRYYNAANWKFKCKEKRAPREGIMRLVEKKAKAGTGTVKMFAGDMLADRTFDGAETIKDFAILSMRTHMCDRARTVLKRIMREYGDSHSMEVYELVRWLDETKLYHMFEEHIPEQWRCLCRKTSHEKWEDSSAAYDREARDYVPSGLRNDE